MRPARLRAAPGWAAVGLVAIGLLAALLRLLLLAHSGGWHSAIEYDDGVHYGSSALFLHGVLPYRDYDFLQPPGITWLLLPCAIVGRLFGDATGLVLARLATIAAATATTILLGRFVGRWAGPRRGLLAAVGYAVAAPALVAGRTVMLEPWLSLLLVLAYGRLAAPRPRDSVPARARDAWIGGAALGLAVTVKAWGVIAALVLVAWMVARSQRAPAGGSRPPWSRVAGGAAAATGVVCLPFFVLAPGRMITDVITTQLSRPADGGSTTLNRWSQLTAIRPLFGSHPFALAMIAVAALVWCAVTAVRRSILGWLMAGQLAVGLVMFGLSGPYFFHYGDYLVVPFAVLLALALPSLHPIAVRARSVRVGIAWAALWVVALGGVVQVADGWSQGQPAAVNVARLTALVRGSKCVTSDQMVLMELADQLGRSCRPWPDPRGTALASLTAMPGLPAGAGPNFYPYGFRLLPAWQQRWRRQLTMSSVVILTGAPCARDDWTPALCHEFERDFRYAGSAGVATPALLPVQVWRRAPHAGAH